MTVTGKEASEGRRRILVAEDGSTFRTAMIRILGGAGFEIEAVADGPSALALLSEKGRRPFDLLIVDIVMPGLSGVELVRRLREGIEDPPPVLYMSGAVTPALNDETGMIGSDPIIAKPFDGDQLLEAVAAALA